MYLAHPDFRQPDDEQAKVWRYMDFTKFVSVLESRQLFFTRADNLDDPFEGSWPKMNVAGLHHVPDCIPQEVRDSFLRDMVNMGKITRNWVRYIAVNCWHMNENESDAMWRLYLKSDEGIAIQSTYSELKESFVGNEEVFLGIVTYIDYNTMLIDPGNLLAPFFHKRVSFEHEREVRALVMKWPVAANGLDFGQETIAHGVKISVDIERMVQRVYVAPSAPEWFADLVQAVVRRYGYAFPVEYSNLNERPTF